MFKQESITSRYACPFTLKDLMQKIYSTLAIVILSISLVQGQTSARSGSKQSGSFMFSAQGGWGYRFGQTEDGLPSGLEDHINALRSGLSVNVEAGYFIDPNNAITLSWGMFQGSNNSDRFLAPAPNGESVSSRVNTKDQINLYMANWLNYFNFPWEKKARLFGQVGIGLASIRSENTFFFDEVPVPVTLTGNGLAYNIGAGVDFNVARNMAIVGQANYVSGRAKVTADGTALASDDEKESVNQLRLTAGLRFRF